jgi:hypothetical protein
VLLDEKGYRMNILADKYKPDENRQAPFGAVLQRVRGIARWLIGLFTFTEEEQLNAGIFVGSERCDE